MTAKYKSGDLIQTEIGFGLILGVSTRQEYRIWWFALQKISEPSVWNIDSLSDAGDWFGKVQLFSKID